MDKPSLFEDVVVSIRAIIESSTSRVTFKEILKQYQELKGCNLPYKTLGYNSAEQLLNSLNDGFRVETSSRGYVLVSTRSSAPHLRRLVTNQKIASTKSKRSSNNHISRNVRPGSRPRDRQSNNFPTSASSLLPLPLLAVPPRLAQGTHKSPPSNTTKEVENMIERLNIKSSPPTCSSVNNPAIIHVQELESSFFEGGKPSELKINSDKVHKAADIPQKVSSRISSASPNYESRLSPNVKSNIKKILKLHPDGLADYKLMSEYEKCTGHALNLSAYGYVHVHNVIEDLKDVSKTFVDPKDGTRVLFPINSGRKSCESAECGVPKSKSEDIFSFVTPTELERMLKIVCYAVTISSESLFKIYSRAYKEPLNLDGSSPEKIFYKLRTYLRYEFINLDEMTISATDAGVEWLKSRIEPAEFNKICGFRIKTPSFPPDAVVEVEHIPDNESLKNVLVGQRFEIFVCWAFTPDKFYFHLVSSMEKLATLTDDINDLYSDEHLSKKYVCPTEKLVRGLPCAAFCRQIHMWNRAILADIDTDNATVKVFFVDFGDSSEVSLTDVRFLRRDFLEVPYFCFLGKMHGVEGDLKDGMWSSQTADAFAHLAVSKKLVAQFQNTQAPFSLLLFDQGRNVIDILLEKNLGIKQKVDYSKVKLPDFRKDSPEFQCSLLTLNEKSCFRHKNKKRDHRNVCKKRPSSALESLKFLKKITCAGKTLNLISVLGNNYLVTAEVFPCFWQLDVLKYMIKDLDLSSKCLIVNTTETPILFQILQEGCDLKSEEEIYLVPVTLVIELLKRVLKNDFTATINQLEKDATLQ